MKILLISIGTRGDMEPFLAIGQLLKEKGHKVFCAFPKQFQNIVDEAGLQFISLGNKFVELLNSTEGKAVMGGGGTGFQKFFANIKLVKHQTAANKELVFKQNEIINIINPDRIIYNGKATLPIIWEIENAGKAMLLSSVPYIHYVKGHTHVAFSSNFGEILNKLTFSLVDFGLLTTANISLKWLDLKYKYKRKQIQNVLSTRKLIYAISPTLFPKSNEWNDNIKVLGYYARQSALEWKPKDELTNFLNKHDKILFITFGSMINPSPKDNTRIFLNILTKNKIPTIINTAEGGLNKPDNFTSDLIHFTDRIPYSWILPKVHAVIHHGGSGTTHLALKYGCATMIIPHIIDQHVWNDIVANLGAGPKGMKIAKINNRDLELKILELMSNEQYRKKAEKISVQMNQENFLHDLYQTIIQ